MEPQSGDHLRTVLAMIHEAAIGGESNTP